MLILLWSPHCEKISAPVKLEKVGTLLSVAAVRVPCETLDVLEDLDSEGPTHSSRN